MNDASRTQGWAICGAAAFLALVFTIGIFSGSYWATAIPVAIIVFFVLGLAGWVGYTIATIQVEPDSDTGPPQGDDDSAPSGTA